MNKLFFTFVSFILLLFIIACDNDMSTTFENSEPQQFKNPLEIYGEIHNKAMDSIKATGISAQNIVNFAHDFVEEECVIHLNAPKETLYKHTSNSLETLKEIELNQIINPSRTNNEVYDSILAEVPIELKPYVYKIFSLIDENLTDSIIIEQKFNEIDLEINNTNLNNDDKNCLWGISSIAKASYIYNLESIRSRAVTAESIVKSDAMGAVGSFLCWKFWGQTLAGGLMFGPTGAVVAAAKEMIKGAIVTSGLHAITGV